MAKMNKNSISKVEAGKLLRGVKSITREEWLQKAIDNFCRPHFKAAGYAIPPKLRVSTGFTSKGKKAIAQHWSPESTDDKIGAIFISPIDDDSVEVLGHLIHEVVHATVGNSAGHGPIFKKCALAVGLEGKMRSTTSTEDLVKKLKDYVKKAGKYPHSKINMSMSPGKKQGTRMIKMVCLNCEYIARSTITKILEVGPLICPCTHEPMEVDLPGDEDDL